MIDNAADSVIMYLVQLKIRCEELGMADPRRSNAWLIIVIILCCCGAVGIFIAALTRSTSVDLEVPTVLVILGALFSFYRYRHWRDNEEEFKCFIQHDAPHSRQNKAQINALKPIMDLRMRETLDQVRTDVPNPTHCSTT